jgi:ABC-type antimicrobial peptide transport system permease subunit
MPSTLRSKRRLGPAERAVFVLREEAIRRGFQDKMVEMIRKTGFDIWAVKKLSPEEIRYSAPRTRGGNWGPGPGDFVGGDPAVIVIAYDPHPIAPNWRQRRKFQHRTNARIFVPVETMRNLFPLKQENSESALSFINYRPLIKAEHMRSKQEIHQIIARRHGFDPKLEDAFEDWDTIENSQRVDKIFDAMDYFLGVVGFVTLALGAIGIVNIMLVSVAERTREIGLRKALGATYKNILTQFFVEGAFLTVFSGGIGLLIATAFVTALAQLPAPQGFDTPRIVPMSALAAILSLAVAGIVAGIYPARKAALLAPVEAMRQE